MKIQDAVDGGGTVHLEGVCELDETLLLDGPPVTLEGVDEAVVVSHANPAIRITTRSVKLSRFRLEAQHEGIMLDRAGRTFISELQINNRGASAHAYS